jgi:hypothetical protein
MQNYHPDGGQVFFPLDHRPFCIPLALPGDDITPEKFVCFRIDGQFCNPASGWEKGQIEKNIQNSRHRLWQRVPAFGSLAALNDWLADQCVLLWQQTQHPEQDTTIWDA